MLVSLKRRKTGHLKKPSNIQLYYYAVIKDMKGKKMLSHNVFNKNFFCGTITFTGWPGGQCSLYHIFTKGTSIARLIVPERMLKGRGLHNNAMPLAVASSYSCHSLSKESTSSGNSKSWKATETLQPQKYNVVRLPLYILITGSPKLKLLLPLITV